jgi:hypothetical protein
MGQISGLRDACDIRRQFSGIDGERGTLADLLSLYRDIDDANAAPGSRWTYNYGAWVLLSLAIERMADKPFEDVMHERVFEPIGMNDSFVCANDAELSTVDDLLRWLAHMESPLVGSADTWNLMTTPQQLTDGTATGYALGLVIDRYQGIDTISHIGSTKGGNAFVLKAPSAALDVVVLINRDDIWSVQLANEILAACLGPFPKESPPPTLSIAAGVFRSPTTGRVVQLSGVQGRQIAMIDGFDMPVKSDGRGGLVPEADFVFGPAQRLTLHGDATQSTSIIFGEAGGVDELHAVKPCSAMGIDEVAGRYRSIPTSTDIEIGQIDGRSQLISKGRLGSVQYDLQPLAAGVWRARNAGSPWGGVLSFDREGKGFRFFSYNTRALPFSKTPR